MTHALAFFLVCMDPSTRTLDTAQRKSFTRSMDTARRAKKNGHWTRPGGKNNDCYWTRHFAIRCVAKELI